MKRRLVISGAIVAFAFGVAIAPRAHATLSSTVEPCQEAIAKSGGKFVGKKLKTIQKCNEKNMKSPGDCTPGDLSAAIAALVPKLTDGIAKKCMGLPTAAFSSAPPTGIGFPGKC